MSSIFVLDSPDVLDILAPVVLRLALLPGPSAPQLSNLLSATLSRLRSFEATSQFNLDSFSIHTQAHRRPPHDARRLHEPLPDTLAADRWAACIRSLWRVALVIEDPEAWDALTSRLLVLRSAVGYSENVEDQWVRRESVVGLIGCIPLL